LPPGAAYFPGPVSRERGMRAEAQAIVEEIKQSLALLRRHL
jgi:hypothetical protein